MAYQESNISDLPQRIKKLIELDHPRFNRLWNYYRNPMTLCPSSSPAGPHRPYRQAQEWGLPARITGCLDRAKRKEVVIENDIAWRVDTLVDYLFGKDIIIESLVEDDARRNEITQLLRQIISNNGGITFFQQLALIGSVYGFVDVLVKLQQGEGGTTARDGAAVDGAGSAPVGEESSSDQPTDTGAVTKPLDGALERIARMVRFEMVEPARALPILSANDWRVVEAYVQVYEKPVATGAKPPTSIWTKLFGGCDSVLVAEVITRDSWQRFENEKLVAQGPNSLGELPLAHVQNLAVPFAYSGTSDVEPLIPLQDELNTRLSDRAHRITMQSFKMFLGKGIENFLDMNIEPGSMWVTDNENASVQTFNGDEGCPSEDNHMSDVREALDKASSVSPIAAGAIKDRVGRLTSAAALRVTLQSLLAKTERKRTTFGAAIERMCELALAWLDVAGLYKTTPDERRIQINWPSPIPENDIERLQEADMKLKLGVSKEIVLRELGY